MLAFIFKTMGSPLIGLAIMFLLTIGVFVLGQFFKGKLRWFRYVFWTIGCLLSIGILIDPFVKNRSEREGEKQIVGIYHLDTDSSRFGNLNLKGYSDLILTAKENNTFIINRPAPFFKSLTGKWNLKDGGDIYFIECSFDYNDKVFQNHNNDLWTFNSYNLSESNTSDRIIFKR
jgi:energy-coupling factor transporter transmembrane protein EcfT